LHRSRRQLFECDLLVALYRAVTALAGSGEVLESRGRWGVRIEAVADCPQWLSP